MENNDKNINWIAKILSKNASADEQQALDQWRTQAPDNEDLYASSQKIWDLVEHSENSPKEVNLDQAWAKFENKLQDRMVEPKGSVISIWTRRLVVAAVLTIGVFGYWWTQSSGDQPMAYSTQSGETLEVQLPDGSKVILNENSELAYDQKFTPRTIKLTGEAFFDVTKSGETFTVNTEKTQVTVLGTSFNIRAYTNQADAEVAVLTGKVAVDLAKADKPTGVVLVAGEKAVLDNNTQQLSKAISNTNNVVSWQTKKLNFKNTTINDVVNTLERHFDIDIQPTENILKCHFTGRFDEANLDEVLQTIAFSLDLQVDKDSDTIKLSGEGCQSSSNE
ncbi:MAG: DUF4974 domain-containing protein [Aureispira sp.]|nr:DUF4974 domain-containing protein [Aureispira sp.]